MEPSVDAIRAPLTDLNEWAVACAEATLAGRGDTRRAVRLASVSKPVTALAVLVAAEEGVLDQITTVLTRASEIGIAQGTGTATAETIRSIHEAASGAGAAGASSARLTGKVAEKALDAAAPVGQNTNPKAGQAAWHGADEGGTTGSWGTTVVDVSQLVVAGEPAQRALAAEHDQRFDLKFL